MCTKAFLLHLIKAWIQFSHSFMSDSLWPHELQHARPPCSSPTPRVHPNSCPLSQWRHPTNSSPVVPFSSPSIFPSISVFSNESALHMRWPKYWTFSFNISPSNEHPGLISLGWTGWISLQSKGLSRVFSTPQFKSINSFALSPLYNPTLKGLRENIKKKKRWRNWGT